MRQLLSKLKSSVRYDLRGTEYLLEPGLNDVLPVQYGRLVANSAFKKHVSGGHVVVIEPETSAEAPPAPEPADDPPELEVNPRDRLPGESTRAYKARLTALDAVPPTPEPEAPAPPFDPAVFFAQWDALEEPTRDALWPGLKPEEQLAIQERDQSK